MELINNIFLYYRKTCVEQLFLQIVLKIFTFESNRQRMEKQLEE